MTSDEGIFCGVCGACWDSRDLQWNGVFKDGLLVDARCPDCQSPEDSAEAEINAATTIYGRDTLGRLTVRPAMRPGAQKAWADVAVIVEGALAALQVFHDETALDAYVAEVRKDADADGLLTEVYVLWHEHAALLDGCGCAQHLSNRHVFGGAA